MRPIRPRIELPPMALDEALLSIELLERIVAALRRAHGMAPTRRRRRCSASVLTIVRDPDDDIF